MESQAARLTELLTDHSLHSRLATAARSAAEDQFSTELIIPKYEAYYEQVCNCPERTITAAVARR